MFQNMNELIARAVAGAGLAQPQEAPPPAPSGGMFGAIIPLVMQVIAKQALAQKQQQAIDQKMMFLDDAKPYMNPNVQAGPAVTPMQMQNTAPATFRQPVQTGGAGRTPTLSSFAPSMSPVQGGGAGTFSSSLAGQPQSGWGSKVLLG